MATNDPTAKPMRTVCAWCGRILRDGPEGPWNAVSHGICNDCARREFPEEAEGLPSDDRIDTESLAIGAALGVLLTLIAWGAHVWAMQSRFDAEFAAQDAAWAEVAAGRIPDNSIQPSRGFPPPLSSSPFPEPREGSPSPTRRSSPPAFPPARPPSPTEDHGRVATQAPGTRQHIGGQQP